MGGVAVIGEQGLTQGFLLAGALVLPAESSQAVRTAWQQLPPDVVVVVLTPSAAEALGDELHADGRPLTVVMPA
jgi:vacuolar-type H+-ATPase subunit F/Vma7